MILIGCLLAFSIAIAPRLMLVLAWIFSERWDIVWQGQWIWPLLGIVFMPFTTVMYLLAWNPSVVGSGIEGWDWMWIMLGVVMDIGKWQQLLANRKEAAAQVQNHYPSGAPQDGAPATTTAPATTEPAAPEPSEAAVEPSPAEAPAAPPPSEAPADDAASSPELAKLEELRASGVLTDDEFEAAKAKLND